MSIYMKKKFNSALMGVEVKLRMTLKREVLPVVCSVSLYGVRKRIANYSLKVIQLISDIQQFCKLGHSTNDTKSVPKHPECNFRAQICQNVGVTTNFQTTTNY